MKSFVFAILLAMTLSVLGQSVTGRFDVAGRLDVGSAPVFNPTNVTGAELYLTYLEFPIPATFAQCALWTNLISPTQLYTNKGATLPTNSATGLALNGVVDSAGYFQNASGASWRLTTDSIWAVVTYAGNDQTTFWEGFLNFQNSGGWGTYLRADSSVGQFRISTSGGGEATTFVVPADSTQRTYDIVLLPNGHCYTNGVDTGITFTPFTDASDNILWGIGKDASSDPVMTGQIKFILISTNYTFTTTDRNNLLTYGQGH